MTWYDDGWTVVSRKSKEKGKSRVWSDAEWADWNAKRESNANQRNTLDNLVKALGEPGKAHKTFLEVVLPDGATEPKWNSPTEVLEKWRDLAAKHQLHHGDRYFQGYEDDFGHPAERFEEKRQAQQRPTTPLQSDLAQETRPTPPCGQKEKVGMLRGSTIFSMFLVHTI